jgi:predicted GNAT family acetyltransferase
MEIIQKNYDDKGVFKAMDNGNEVGEMTYVWAGTDKFIIDHTHVNDSHANEGIGSKLVTKAVEYARKNDVKIIPLCPFASSVFKKNPDYMDVLDN